jgi:type IV secretion system protein VirD4
VVFGGGKDIHFYRELADLIGQTTLMRASHTRHAHATSRSWSPTEVPVLQPGEVRAIPDRQALVLSETREPIIATLDRCIEGSRGAELLSAQHHARRTAQRAPHRKSQAADSGDDARRLGLPR